MITLCIVLAVFALSGWWLAAAFWLEQDPTSARRILFGLAMAWRWLGRPVEHHDFPARTFVWSVSSCNDEWVGLANGADVKLYAIRAVGPWWRRRWGYFLRRWQDDPS